MEKGLNAKTENCIQYMKLYENNDRGDKIIIAENYRFVVAKLLSIFEKEKKKYCVDCLLLQAQTILNGYGQEKNYNFEVLKQTENDRKKKQIRLNIIPKSKHNAEYKNKYIKPKSRFVIITKEDNITLDYPETINTIYKYVKYLYNYVYGS